MEYLVQLILTPVVLWVAQKWISGIYFKDKRAVIWTAVLVLVIGYLVGWLLHFLIHLATLGILALLGLEIVVRIIANSIIIELVDQFRDDFDTEGFLPSLWLAVLLSVVWGLVALFF